MKTETVWDKYRHYLNKYISVTWAGLQPSAIKGRFIGPKVLMNSLPKSGTNLLETALSYFPLLRHHGDITISTHKFKSEAHLIAKIESLSRGQYAPAHVNYSPKVAEAIHRCRIRNLLVIRDPRDVCISHEKYVTHIDKAHRAHEFFKSLPDDNARLLATIYGEKKQVEPIRDLLLNFAGWFHDSNTLIVRFEDLVGADGGGDEKKQLTAIQQVANHLNIPLSESQIQQIAKNTFSTNSSTFRKGQINVWRETLKPEHKNAFKETIQDLLELYGYEKDSNW